MSGKPAHKDYADLFGRVVTILEQARTNVVRSVNSEMVTAYWLIGREIVEELQKREGRAGYGRQILKIITQRMNTRFIKLFSVQNLELFRRLYLAFQHRCLDEFCRVDENPTHCVGFSAGFMPSLGWSHYRALMRVEHPAARAYYEREAASRGMLEGDAPSEPRSFEARRMQLRLRSASAEGRCRSINLLSRLRRSVALQSITHHASNVTHQERFQ